MNAPSDGVTYRDGAGRFAFSYPASFGSTSTGTNDGFGNRVAAIRFSVFSAQGNGGEAALLQGSRTLVVMAAGGLYDAIVREALPAALHGTIDQVLAPLSLANFCDQIGLEQHVDLDAAVFASLAPAVRAAIGSIDRQGNVAPEVLRCSAAGDTITFEKEAAVVPGGPRRRVYGAVRFLTGRYSAFQLIRGGSAVDQTVLTEMTAVVTSWRES